MYINNFFKRCTSKFFSGLNKTILIDVLTCQTKIHLIYLLNEKSTKSLHIYIQKVSRYPNLQSNIDQSYKLLYIKMLLFKIHALSCTCVISFREVSEYRDKIFMIPTIQYINMVINCDIFEFANQWFRFSNSDHKCVLLVKRFADWSNYSMLPL